MDIRRVLLSGSGTSGDGSTWNDDSSGTAAFIAGAGWASAVAASAVGDTVYVKGTSSETGATVALTLLGLAAAINPIRIIGVRTDAPDTVAKTDIILGLREGDATRAYLQTGAEAPPFLDKTSTNDVIVRGGLFLYGITIKSADNLTIGGKSGFTGITHLIIEECKFSVPDLNDLIIFGANENNNDQKIVVARNSEFDAGGGNFQLDGPTRMEFFNSVLKSTTVGSFQASEFTGTARFYGSDLSACNATLFDISNHQNSNIELWNCKLPASHILVTGTAQQFYTIKNYSSEDSTALGSGDSEQAFEIRTHQGDTDLETVKVRTGGANDGATGSFAWALTANNVNDNFVDVPSPWLRAWVEGDGTAKTLNVFIANDDAESAANLLEDDEIYLEVLYPSEAGVSKHDYLPDDGAPGDGGGRTQLLGTPVDIATDGSTWGAGANNKQKLSVPIAPDYQGVLYCRPRYSKSASPPVLFVDPFPEVV